MDKGLQYSVIDVIHSFCLLLQSSSAISSADLFGNSSDSALDVSASDLINRLSFQVMFYHAAAFFV